jgi:hypothetical protein
MARDWAAVADAMAKRLAEREMTQAELVQLSRLAPMTIRELLFNSAQRKRGRQTLEALDKALGWPPGHLQAIADGRDSSELDAEADDPVMVELAEVKKLMTVMSSRLDEIERRLAGGGGQP